MQRSKLRGTPYDTLHSLYEIGGPFFVQFTTAFLNALKICNQNAGYALWSGSKAQIFFLQFSLFSINLKRRFRAKSNENTIYRF